MPAPIDDWRRQHQQRYLPPGTPFVRVAYAPRPRNDHDHCEMCSAKFMLGSRPDTLQTGFKTIDDDRWVCEPCWSDFAQEFGWVERVIQ